jgi:hypothetical protein
MYELICYHVFNYSLRLNINVILTFQEKSKIFSIDQIHIRKMLIFIVANF